MSSSAEIPLLSKSWKAGDVKKLDIPIKFRCLVSRVISNNQNDVLVRDIFMELIKDPHATVGLAGPKGTGKSTTLLLYAYYLNLCNCPLLYCGHDEIVLWSGKGENTVAVTVEEFERYQWSSTSPAILADFGFTSPASEAIGFNYIRIMSEVYSAIYCGVHVVVAFSSGEGWLMGFPSQVMKKKALNALDNVHMALKVKLRTINFTEEELDTFLKAVWINRSAFPTTHDFYSLTNGNPYLVSSLLSKQHHHAFKFERMQSHIQLMLTYILQPLVHFIEEKVEHSLNDLFSENCETLIALAERGETISDAEFGSRYYNTWYVLEKLVYTVEHAEDADKVVLKANFPKISRIVKQIVVRESISRVAKIPAVKGYIFEEDFFSFASREKFNLLLFETSGNDSNTVSLSDISVVDRQIIKRLHFKELYKLIDCHTAIDAVLLYSYDKINYLFLFQLSQSSYKEHKSKANGVYKKIPDTVSKKNVSVLRYYRDLAVEEVVRVAFVYVSPKEDTKNISIASDLKLREHLPRQCKSDFERELSCEVDYYGVIEHGCVTSALLQ